MRVIAGVARGRRLKTVPSRDVRPTADRVKEALFSMIESRIDLEGRHALDLYAGSGALGIEALSRGAALCTFVERDQRAREALVENLRACGFDLASEVLAAPVSASLLQLSRRGMSFDLVLLDPPYADRVAQRVLEDLASRALFAAGCVVAVEHAADEIVAETTALRLTRTRRYGKTCVSLLTSDPTEDSAAT